jgi:hypothetical protein
MAKRNLNELIQALLIFRRYGNPVNPTCCEHDILMVLINPDLVSIEDKKRLSELGFDAFDEYWFSSFRFGSA